MKKPRILFFIIFFSLFLCAQSVFASTIITEDITGDTTWTSEGSPYIVNKNLYIAPEATLQIYPGVVVKFEYTDSFFKRGMYVAGKIVTNGTEANPIYFTSNYDDEVGGSTDDEEFCYFEEYDEDGNGVGSEICESFDLGDPYVGDWGEIYFDHSSGSVLSNTILKYAQDSLTFFTSTATIKNLTVNESEDVLTIFNDSRIDFSGINISGIYDDPITIFNNSSFTGDNLKIENVYTSRTDAIVLFNNSDLSLKDSTFIDCPNEACITFFDGRDDFYKENPSSLKVENSLFDGGLGSAFLTFGTTNITTDIKNSVIQDFEYFGIENYSTTPVFAENNFWGDPSGPFHTELNPTGLGELMYGPMDFTPWLFAPPCKADCFSNVLFLPGMQGSRLYEEIDGEEEELWYTRKDAYHKRMFLDENGKSINQIYAKDDTRNTGEDDETGLIDEASLGINVYESFIDRLRDWKEDKVINDYAFVPYDWRLSLEDITSSGKVSGGNVSFMEGVLDEPYLVAQLRALAESSKSGKVTIVAHSYGGIVTKALLEKLKDASDPLYDKIDKIIFVAVPQIGTPQSAVAILHGTGIGPLDVVMDKDISRTFGENMPTAYNLLPRESYFGLLEGVLKTNTLINFENNLLFKDQTAEYGGDISSAKELKDYLLGTDGRRKPGEHDTKSPNIGNSKIYDDAEAIYEMQDAWSAPAGTKIIQVAGWGAETISGLDYKVYLAGLGQPYASYKIREVIDGDGTVILPSALWMSPEENPNTERWWVNLEEYDTIARAERSHADILEISHLLNFLESKIKNTLYSDTENIIVSETSTLVAKGKRLHYTLHSPLYLGVTDAEGRFTGRDAETGEIKQEIPGVTYREVGEVQLLSVPAELAHTLKLAGYAEGVFALDVDEVSGNDDLGSILFQGIESGEDTVVRLVASSDPDIKTFTLELDFDGDGIFEKTINPWAPPEPEEEEEEKPAPPIAPSGGGGSGGGGSGFPFVPQVLASAIEALPAILPPAPEPEPVEEAEPVPEPKGEVLGESVEPKAEPASESPTSSSADKPQLAGSEPLNPPGEEKKSIPIVVIIIGGAIVILLAGKYIFKL